MKKVLRYLILVISLMSLTGCFNQVIKTNTVVGNFDFKKLNNLILENELTFVLEEETYYGKNNEFIYSSFKNIDKYVNIFEESGLNLSDKINENKDDVLKLSKQSGISYSISKHWYDENYQYLLKTNDNFGNPTSSIEITPMYENSNKSLLDKGFRKNNDSGYTKYYPFGEIHIMEDDESINIYTSFNFMLLDYYDKGLIRYIEEIEDTLRKINVNNISKLLVDLENSLTVNLEEKINNTSYTIYSKMTDAIEQVKETEISIYK